MIRAALLLYLAGSCSLAVAQTTIQGIVKDKGEGKALAGISITVKEKNAANLLAYTLSDENGRYLLNIKSPADSLSVSVGALSFKKQIQTIANKSQNLDFTLTSETIQLKEVKVKPPRIRQISDTLSYQVDAFLDSNDRSIGDVLKKLPGITVKEDGSINYNNKPINKFYIEGADLLQGRYGIATNNIAAKDVATVEVLENHQPVKALKKREFTDEGAVNLKLKDSAKGVLVANGQLGTGLSPLLWNNELFSMLFNKERKHINVYKGNNTGYNAGNELNALYGGNRNMGKNNMLFIQAPSPPGISQKRFFFNQSNTLSSNNLWTLGKNYQLNATLAYLNDRQERSGYSHSEYNLGKDSLLSVEESVEAVERVNSLNASVQLVSNQENIYLDNQFDVRGEWNADRGSIASPANTGQDLDKSFYSIANTLSLVKNLKKNNIKVYSFNGYSSNLENLSIQSWLYNDLLIPPGGGLMVRQRLHQKHFSSSNRFTLEVDNDAFKQNYEAGININLRTLNAALGGQTASGEFPDPPDSLINQLKWNKYEMWLRPEYVYASDKVKATLSLPVSFTHFYGSDKINQDDNENTGRILFNPNLRFRYNLSLLLNLTISAGLNSDFGSIENRLTGYMMKSYRSIVKNDGQLPQTTDRWYRLDMAYRHPLHEFFLNAGASYSRGKSNLLHGYHYRGMLSLKKSYRIPNSNDNYIIYARLSKGIEQFASTLSLETDYRSGNSTQFSQDVIMDYGNQNYRIKTGIASKIQKWASLSYSIQYSQSKNSVENNQHTFRPIRNTVHQGQLNFFPAPRFSINLAFENFYNSSVLSGSRSLNFADAGIKYRYRKLEINLEYSNIFNARQFVSSFFDEANAFYSEYTLRPSQVLLAVRFKIK